MKLYFFRKITRKKRKTRKNFKETRGIEPQFARCEFRVLTITPSEPLLIRDPNLKILQYLPKIQFLANFWPISALMRHKGPILSHFFLKKCNFSYKALFCSNLLFKIHFGLIGFNLEVLGPILRLFANSSMIFA